jgi:hypothetical protein
LNGIFRIPDTIGAQVSQQSGNLSQGGWIMQMIRTITFLTGVALLAACGKPESASRNLAVADDNLTLATQGPGGTGRDETVLAPIYDVQAVTVIVPSELRASEANVFYPLADIVWRGEPLGNRHAQVRQIFVDAASAATGGMTRGRPAIVELNVTRFHSVTEKTRYSVGGVHSMKFTITVRDAQSGAVIDGPREVVADVKAVGGARALAEDAAGRTQRVVVMERLVYVLRRELSAPMQAAVARAETAPVVVAN